MQDWPLLSIAIFLPLVGAALVLPIRTDNEERAAVNARWTALWTSIAVLIVVGAIWFMFDPSTARFQFVERALWIPAYGIEYHLGIDGISLFLIVLSALLTPVCILCSWEAVRIRTKEYMVAFLVMESLMIGVFCALDFVLFYLFFEAILIPMFLIIGVWGGPRRIYSAFKFFLYTLVGSVLLLIAMLTMYFEAGTTNIPELMSIDFRENLQRWLWLAMFASFAVKVPMWPVHTWLPDAHVEAPTAGSVILAGVLLKMGAYGFVRFSLPMLPDASEFFAPLVFVLSIVAIVYTSLVALMQEDMKKLIAYSSVAHMGFVTIGIFSLNQQGIEGSIFQMLSHGVVSAALFLCVGVIYDRTHSREIARHGGLVNRMPRYALVFMIFVLAAVGLPGTSGFVGEFLVLLGAFQANSWVAVLATTGIILGAAYMLWLYRRVVFGELLSADLRSIADCNRRELLYFAPLIAAVLVMGVWPDPFLNVMHASVEQLVTQAQGTFAQGAR